MGYVTLQICGGDLNYIHPQYNMTIIEKMKTEPKSYEWKLFNEWLKEPTTTPQLPVGKRRSYEIAVLGYDDYNHF